jgi:hypothetical protein
VQGPESIARPEVTKYLYESQVCSCVFKCRGLLFNLFSLGGGGGGGKTPTHTHTYGMSFEDPACVISPARLHYDSNGQLSIAYLRVVQTLIYPIYLS